MKKDTRLKFNAFTAGIAALNEVETVAEKFNVTPSVQQTLQTRIQESSAFLGMINMITVDEKEGQALGLGVGSSIASTTNTQTNDRTPTDPTSLTAGSYNCQQVNFDTALTYGKIDAWAKFKDFEVKVRDVITKRQALDLLLMGFNGTSRAPTSNRVANPKLQDVAKGWLQKIRDEAPARRMSQGTKQANKVVINLAGTGDYKNLDALVLDAVNNLLDPVFAEDTELKVIVGRELLTDKYFPIVNNSNTATEKVAADVVTATKRIGNLEAIAVPNFPANAILITRLDNLSIYEQEGSRRRTIQDNPKRDQVEDYQSANIDFVIEDYAGVGLIENITLE